MSPTLSQWMKSRSAFSMTMTQASGRAGLTGKLFGNWLLIDLLWVEDSLRRKGVGSSLLQAAEDAARDYGAKRVFLNTFRFQAPDFYLKHGYREVFRLDEFPYTGTKYYFTKDLV